MTCVDKHHLPTNLDFSAPLVNQQQAELGCSFTLDSIDFVKSQTAYII